MQSEIKCQKKNNVNKKTKTKPLFQSLPRQKLPSSCRTKNPGTNRSLARFFHVFNFFISSDPGLELEVGFAKAQNFVHRERTPLQKKVIIYIGRKYK